MFLTLCWNTFPLVVLVLLLNILLTNRFYMGAYSAKAQLQGVRETNIANRDIAQDTNAMNLQLAREENAFNERMWNLTNQYNDPAKQVQRLRGAGLSSAAAAQAASGFEAQPIQSANLANQQIGAPMVAPPESAYAGLNIVGLMREAVSLIQQTKDLEMQATEQEFQKPLLMSKQDAAYINNAQNAQALKEAYATYPYRFSSIVSKAKGDAVQPELLEAQKRYIDEQYKLAKQNFDFLTQKNPKELDKFDKEMSKLDEEYNNLKKSGKLIEANVSLTDEERHKVSAEGKVLAEQWLQQHLETTLRKFGYPETHSGRIGALVASGELNMKDISDYQKGIVSFIDSHGNYFNGSDAARSYWHNILNEGEGKEVTLPLGRQIINGVKRTLNTGEFNDAVNSIVNYKPKFPRH